MRACDLVVSLTGCRERALIVVGIKLRERHGLRARAHPRSSSLALGVGRVPRDSLSLFPLFPLSLFPFYIIYPFVIPYFIPFLSSIFSFLLNVVLPSTFISTFDSTFVHSFVRSYARSYARSIA